MTTMGDMNNLLMCFFIVLMGDITEVVKEEFLLTVSSFRGALSIVEGGKTMTKGRLADMGHNIMALPAEKRAQAFSKAYKRALELLKPEITARQVRITEEERGLVITLASDIFFDSGSASLRPESRPILKKVGHILKSFNNFVRIEGHTDNTPVSPGKALEQYNSNWELSGTRSINVLRHFTEDQNLPPEQLSAVAFGQYRPIDDNNTPEGRAMNRRVDIVVLKERFVEPSTRKEYSRPLPDEEWR